ncbi:aldo/keto reductase [Sphingomonas oligophenolica]|uniref:Aldo/keto reductase n=2 Tax=Sphingomonas oligophenolica TaxID=301154 RepID=A0ABU9Y7M0_9SPHN
MALPRLGMGTAAIGNLYRPVSDDAARQTVMAALAAGIRYFDTAPHYGFGLAERRLGDALAEADPRGSAIISTKVGRLLVPSDATGARHGFVDADPFEPVFDYSADAIRRSHEASLRRLRRDRIDILLAHDLGRMTHGDDHPAHLRTFLDSGYGAMRALREAGAVDSIGIGVNEVAICQELLDRVDLDVILLAGRHTLLDRRSAATLFETCAKRGVSVIIGGPYNSGILAQDGIGGATGLHYDYRPPGPETLARAIRIETICARFGVSLPAAALQFPLRSPQVAAVIPGMVGPDQVAASIARLATPIPDALWAALDEEETVIVP